MGGTGWLLPIVCILLLVQSTLGNYDNSVQTDVFGDIPFSHTLHPVHWTSESVKDLVLNTNLSAITRLQDMFPFFGSWIQDRDVLKEIKRSLTTSRFLVVEDVLNPALAEQVWSELMALDPRLFIERSGAYVSYQFWIHQCTGAGPEKGPLSPTLDFLAQLWYAPMLRTLFSKLANADTEGPESGIYSWMKRGNYISGHNDHHGNKEYGFRRIAFVIQLAKNWDPSWGGDFVWSRSSSVIQPKFNRMVLFEVNRWSEHTVTPVHQSAGESVRRLAFSGWYTTLDPDEVTKMNEAPDLRPLYEHLGAGTRILGEKCLRRKKDNCIESYRTPRAT